ncbi:MAG: coiled-coil domain-containing protein [Planctomycetota bacterium]|jgi:hypothetical protein
MKTFIKTIAVFLVLCLPAASCATAPVEKAINKTEVEINELQDEIRELQDEIAQADKDDKGKLKAKLLQKRAELETAESQLNTAQMQLLEAYKQAELAQEQADISRVNIGLVEAIPEIPAIPGIPLSPFSNGNGKVLVIPAAELKAKDLITIMEDMSVMSRIFDKKLSQTDLVRAARGGGGRFFSSRTSFLHSGHETESIYLDGYAALFLIEVGFPLAPPPKVQEEEIEEEFDPLWEETKQEIHTPQDLRIKTRLRRSEQQPQYDAEKVEELKARLIKALKHAANIRNLKSGESVIITVTSETSQLSRDVRVLLKANTIVRDDEDEEFRIHLGPISDEIGISPTVMTIRAKKSDVDAFAKDDLNFEQFRKKVHIFTY